MCVHLHWREILSWVTKKREPVNWKIISLIGNPAMVLINSDLAPILNGMLLQKNILKDKYKIQKIFKGKLTANFINIP